MRKERNERDPITVSLVGLAKERREVLITASPEQILGLPEEFQSALTINGAAQRLGKRVLIDLEVTTSANLECDRSLEQYSEPICTELSIECRYDNELALAQRESSIVEDGVKGLFDDAREVDISEDIRQALFLSLPMKRVAPQYRNNTIEEIHPHINDVNEDSSGTWDALKKLK